MSLFYLPNQIAIDSNGDPMSGAQLFFYEAGTLTALDTYTDADLQVAHSNPVEADAGGLFDPIFLQDLPYRVILKTSADVQVWDSDDVNEIPSTFGSGGSTKSTDYTIVTADKGKFFSVDNTATITLPSIATVGAGFPVAILHSGSGNETVTIDPGATTINSASSLAIYPGGFAILTSTDAEWRAVYQEGVQVGSFAVTLTGFASDPTPTVAFIRDGLRASLYINAGSTGTSDDTAMTMTGVPAALRPTTTVIELTRVTDNGTTQLGVASIASTGTITFGLFGEVGATYSTAAFTNSGTKGLPSGWSLHYTIN